MFENAGRKIQTLVKIITIFTIATYILIGIILGVASGSAGFFILFLLIFGVVGTIIAWISGLVLYAFGEMCENIYNIRREMYSISGKINGSQALAYNLSDNKMLSSGSWECTECNEINVSTSVYCKNCGNHK